MAKKRKYRFVRKEKVKSPREKTRVRKATPSAAKIEKLVVDWSIANPRNLGIGRFLKERGYSKKQIDDIFVLVPAPDWHERAHHIKDGYTREIVKSQLDFVAELNDQLIKAGKLGMAKALEMMTKLEVGTYRDEAGKLVFGQFRPSDLKSCMDSLTAAMKIMRTSLGLPSDEGAIHVWQQLNLNPANGQKVEEKEEGPDPVAELEKTITYDELTMIITHMREMRQKAIESGDVIEMEKTA